MISTSSIEETYKSPTNYAAPFAFSKILASNDDYIAHATLRKYKNRTEKPYVFILTRTSYYKLHILSHQKIWCRNLSEICGVFEDPDNPCKLRMMYL